MDVFRTDRIRNVVLLGHSGSGKTSLTEAMAYLSGMTNRLGKVTDGNTVSDFDKEEIKRKCSISTTLVPVVWGKNKINVLDTPGMFDFVGEAQEAASAADAAVIVVSGKAGVQVGTQKAWELCEKYNLPRMIFVTEMDQDDVSYREVVEQLTELYGKRIAPLHMPLRENGKFVGYINIVKNKGRRYIEKDKKEECPIPNYSVEYLEKYRETLMESVAETSEEFMDRYFGGEEFSVAEISAALAMNVGDGTIVPVCMGSPVNLQGVSNLLDDICGYFPDPSTRPCAGINLDTNEIFEANYDFAKPKSATIFKTIVDPFLGKYSMIKVCSGVIKSDDVLYNVDQESEEKLSKLYVLEGSKPIEVPELHAGDIGAIAKLGDAIVAEDAGKYDDSDDGKKDETLARPQNFIFNVILTLAVIIVLVLDIFPSYYVFMVGCALGILVNYRGKKLHNSIIKSHASAGLSMASTILCAGVFLGVLSKSGIMEKMAVVMASFIPASLGRFLPIIIGILSVPLALLFDTDSYFYGLLPVLVSVGNQFGVNPAHIAIAMVVCRNCATFISPVAPATYLGIGLAGVEIKDHIKYCFGWQWGVSIVCLIAGLILGVIHF